MSSDGKRTRTAPSGTSTSRRANTITPDRKRPSEPYRRPHKTTRHELEQQIKNLSGMISVLDEQRARLIVLLEML